MNKDWKSIAIEAAQQAGEKILEIYKTDFEVYTKADDSPVTTADLASNSIINFFLSKTGIPILSEEEDFGSYGKRKNLKYLWIVDPLDGTKEFLNKFDDFAVNIALISENKPVFGLIYKPVTKQLIFAEKGKGAFLLENNKETKLPLPSKRANYIFLKSRSHPDAQLEEYLENLKTTTPNLEIKIVGSSIKFFEIALGNADEYTRFNPTMEWDTASGQIIVNEVGKSLIDNNTKKEMLYNRENLKNNGFRVADF